MSLVSLFWSVLHGVAKLEGGSLHGYSQRFEKWDTPSTNYKGNSEMLTETKWDTVSSEYIYCFVYIAVIFKPQHKPGKNYLLVVRIVTLSKKNIFWSDFLYTKSI